MSKKIENPFRILYDRAYEFVTDSIPRRVFFSALVAIVVIVIFMQFYSATWVTVVLLATTIIAVGAILVDLIRKRQMFGQQIRGMEKDIIERLHKRDGDDGLSALEHAFTFQERDYIKKKTRGFNTMIVFLLVIIIVLVATIYSIL